MSSSWRDWPAGPCSLASPLSMPMRAARTVGSVCSPGARWDDGPIVAGSLKGRLLVANPALPDPNFDRTVVLVLAHEDEGSLGLILNRPSDMEVDAPLPQWEHLAAQPSVVFMGGPVAPGAAICLAQVSGALEAVGWTPLTGELGNL